MGKNIYSLLDSGIKVSLITQACFKKYQQALVKEFEMMKHDAHRYATITVSKDQVMHCITYLEWDIDILGLNVPWVGFLVTTNPVECKGHHRKAKVPWVVGCNVLRLACIEFLSKYKEKVFDQKHCPPKVPTVLYAQLVVYYLSKMKEVVKPTGMNGKNHKVEAYNDEEKRAIYTLL